MKKKFTILFMLLTSAVTITTAQFRLLKSIDEIGIVAGPSIVSLRGSSEIENGQETKVGYNFGLTAKWAFEKHNRIKINSKIVFERKGNKVKVLSSYYDPVDQVDKYGYIEAITNLDYITIPVNIEYSLTKKENLYLYGGGYGSYLNKGIDVVNFSFFNTISTSKVSGLKKYDFGLIGGIGYTFLVKGRSLLSIELYTSRGLFDISSRDPNTSASPVIKTNSFTFNIIYLARTRK